MILDEAIAVEPIKATCDELPAVHSTIPEGAILRTVVGRKGAGGSVAILEYTVRACDEVKVIAPFPLLAVEILPSGGEARVLDVTGTAKEAANQAPAKFKMPHHDRPWLAVERDAAFKLEFAAEAAPLRVRATMRRATAALPTLTEGANRIEVRAASPQWNIEVVLEVEVRKARY